MTQPDLSKMDVIGQDTTSPPDVQENGGGTSWWPGEIDEVAVYDYALSAARIQAHYKVGTGQ
jgi:hypothetical protein